MLIFILKFSACLAIFMVFYKVFLETSSIHNFKRFYLLTALILALIIPSLTIVEYIEPVTTDTTVINDSLATFDITQDATQEQPTQYLSVFLWSIYGLGVLIFLLKFCLNLNGIMSRIKNNPKLKSEHFINVLMSNLTTPHTFFNYIFLDKNKFETAKIPKEVLLHEQTHAKQMHSIDVLILESLQILFWFNPLVYLLKRDVKLNHEFLADRAVLKNGIQPSSYQQLLLAFSSNANEPQLANAINYSSIKKRFTVMKTKTPTLSVWIRSLLLLPVLAVVLYSFTERKQVYKDNQNTVDSLSTETLQEGATAKQLAEYNKLAKYCNLQIEKKGIIKHKDVVRLKHLYSLMTDEQIKSAEAFPDFSKLPPPPPPPPVHKGKVSKSLANTYNKWIRGLKNPDGTYNRITSDDYKYFISIYNNMTDEQKENSAGLPPPPPPPTSPKVNEVEVKSPPPPPPPTQENEIKTGFIEINNQAHYFVAINNETKYYNRQGFQVSKTGKTISNSQVNASDVVPNQYITKVYGGNKIIAEFKDNKPQLSGEINIPPPAPKSTLDIVIELAKKNAKFHYENEEISSDKAIALVKENSALNLLVKHTSNQPFLAYLSKEPVNMTQQKSEEPVQVNGKTPIHDQLHLTKKEVMDLALTFKNTKVISFKFKIPGKPSQSIIGNTLNKNSKVLLDAISKDTVVQIFDIKDSDNIKHPPVMISITN